MIPDHLIEIRDVRSGDDKSFGIHEAKGDDVRVSLKCPCSSREFRLSGNDKEHVEGWVTCVKCGKDSVIHSGFLHGWYTTQLKHDAHFAEEYEDCLLYTSDAADE